MTIGPILRVNPLAVEQRQDSAREVTTSSQCTISHTGIGLPFTRRVSGTIPHAKPLVAWQRWDSTREVIKLLARHH
ncbi:hypothetical protein BJX68DRAFT_229549 [Aspergillus pseudodeflectus]|uniref:Uncharacterized protein n=1 Tax=Aspergillus pseudodeflectus TaxID=176178 RepID=A0ABR4KX24_9EURO